MIGYASNRSDQPLTDVGLILDQFRDAGLANPARSAFPWTRDYTTAEWLDQLDSHSDHAALPADLRQALFDEIGAAIDHTGGGFTMSYTSILLSGHRAA